MPRIALVTGAAMPKPDPESHLLVAALRRLDIDAELLPWDGPTDWAAYPLVALRTPWDYFQRLDEFLGWCRRTAAATRLLNPLPVIEWNSHKRYLAELAAAGLPTVPTLHLPRGCPDGIEQVLARDWPQVVVKPAVSIGAIGTLRCAAGAPVCQTHLNALLTDGDVLVQPFVESIASHGEASLIYFGGRYSHAIRKRPKPGDFRVQDLYGGSIGPHAPDAAEIETADAALAAVPAPTAYARIDLVRHAGQPAIMEIELIEPELFLGATPDAADRFAAALGERLGA